MYLIFETINKLKIRTEKNYFLQKSQNVRLRKNKKNARSFDFRQLRLRAINVKIDTVFEFCAILREGHIFESDSTTISTLFLMPIHS